MCACPSLFQLNFLSTAVQLSHHHHHHHPASLVPFFLPLFKTWEGQKKKDSPPVKSTAMSGSSQCDCWENSAAVFVKWEWEGVRGFFWSHAYERCMVWGYTSNLYMDKGAPTLSPLKQQRERRCTTKRETEFTSIRLLCKLLTRRRSTASICFTFSLVFQTYSLPSHKAPSFLRTNVCDIIETVCSITVNQMWGPWQTKPLMHQIWLVNPMKNLFFSFFVSWAERSQRPVCLPSNYSKATILASNLNMLSPSSLASLTPPQTSNYPHA